jgi:hypothetical protein
MIDEECRGPRCRHPGSALWRAAANGLGRLDGDVAERHTAPTDADRIRTHAPVRRVEWVIIAGAPLALPAVLIKPRSRVVRRR